MILILLLMGFFLLHCEAHTSVFMSQPIILRGVKVNMQRTKSITDISVFHLRSPSHKTELQTHRKCQRLCLKVGEIQSFDWIFSKIAYKTQRGTRRRPPEIIIWMHAWNAWMVAMGGDEDEQITSLALMKMQNNRNICSHLFHAEQWKIMWEWA